MADTYREVVTRFDALESPEATSRPAATFVNGLPHVTRRPRGVGVRDRGWVHHIPRLIVLGSDALPRGWGPHQLATGSPSPSSTGTRG